MNTSACGGTAHVELCDLRLMGKLVGRGCASRGTNKRSDVRGIKLAMNAVPARLRSGQTAALTAHLSIARHCVYERLRIYNIHPLHCKCAEARAAIQFLIFGTLYPTRPDLVVRCRGLSGPSVLPLRQVQDCASAQQNSTMPPADAGKSPALLLLQAPRLPSDPVRFTNPTLGGRPTATGSRSW